MYNKILAFLKSYHKKTVSIAELEKLFSGDIGYEEFANRVNEFVDKGVLSPIKAHEYNYKSISLANTYRINRVKLQQDLLNEIEHYHFLLHPQIQLKDYFSLSETQWRRDLPWIEKIDAYLKAKGLPQEEATAPERSYHLVGDEKWIAEKGGQKVLQRLGLWDLLKITSVPDPLMLAVNPACFNQPVGTHLVVENKATYYALLELLPETRFLSLVYGAGWKIVSGISMLEGQLNLPDQKQQIYYFGDLDNEGISIWYALNTRRPVFPATDFYRALLRRPFTRGKENQQSNEEALASFLRFFEQAERDKIVQVLNSSGYYPQESLNRQEVQEIWRQGSWT